MPPTTNDNRLGTKSVPEESAFRRAYDGAYLERFAGTLSRIGMYEMGFRPAGTEAGHRAGAAIEAEMRRIGLADVRREPFPVYAWGFRGASIQVRTPGGRTVAASSFPPTPGTPPQGMAAELVDVGLGTAADYDGRDVRGKLAFARLDVDKMRWMGVLAYEAELHGAAGVVFYYLNGYAQHPSGDALNTHDGMCRDTIPVLQISVNDGRYLAQLLEGNPSVPVTLTSHVDAQPAGTGHNVIGILPGLRYPGRFITVGAHYDAWFSGYWDNVSGVAGMLAIAKGLVDAGYQPDHTLVFVATDAEEFGAPDSTFDWLVGAHALLQSHPEWRGQTTCCFNFDTLCLKVAEYLRFFGSTEMVGFMREATAEDDLGLDSFPQRQVEMADYVTPWTESYSWTYFGVPVVQPTFDRGGVGETHYHTQFDTAAIVDLDKSNEAVRLYGSLLVRLDRTSVVPFDWTARATAMRASVDWERAAETGLAHNLDDALNYYAARASQTVVAVAGRNRRARAGTPAGAPEADAINQQLRATAAYLLAHCSDLGGDFSHTVMYRHQVRQGNLAALEGALAALDAGDGQAALEALTDRKTGLANAYFGQYVSYPTYYHYTVGAVNPARPHLFWGKDRALPYIDCWMLLHEIKDKLARGVDGFGPEIEVLTRLRDAEQSAFRDDLSYLAQVARKAAELLPLERLQAME
jgi:Iap family predicted aminopeptidase